MAKSKAPTPQEMYRARKQREEQEKTAYLPPGIYNQGNTCFMNSVLQGLIATQLLRDLAHFRPIPSSIQEHYPSPTLASRRSPLLTNGHNLGGKYEQPWINPMPIGDVFLDLMVRAWDSQVRRGRESLSAKQVLGALGRKYDQYLDFAQQDAHEFLRILLDATRMEELDVIKKRQPPPESTKKRRRTTITPSSIHPSKPPSAAPLPPSIPEEDKLMTLSDMIFGGKFASILVCQKCKHVSQTCEDFNDISLSIKAEDYHESKRDRLKNLAKRFTSFPTSSLGANHEVPRPSSVPPSPREREYRLGGHEEPPATHEPRRRSIDVVADANQDADSDQSASESKNDAPDDFVVVTTGNGVVSEGKHVEIVATAKPEKKDKKDDGWAKIGRRLSMTVGLGKGSKDKKNHSRDRSSKDMSRTSMQLESPLAVPSDDPTSSGSGLLTRSTQRNSASGVVQTLPPPAVLASPLPRRANGHEPLLNPQTPSPRPATPPIALRPHHIQRGKSPRPPKPTIGEQNFLREILADVVPASSKFTIFPKPPHSQQNSSNRSVSTPSGSSPNLWLGINHFSGIEECLRMFTSVEILDGENMVGCRRCWKVANGEYEKPPGEENGNGDDDSDSADHGSVESHSAAISVSKGVTSLPPDLTPVRPSLAHIPTSMSTPTIPLYTHTNTSDDRSVSSLPGTEPSTIPDSDIDSVTSVRLIPKDDEYRPSTPGGLPIPVISTTAPESPTRPYRSTRIGLSLPPPIDRSVSSPASTPSTPIARPTPRLGQVLNHPPHPSPTTKTVALPVPGLRRTDLDMEESSGAESDTSIATSTRSSESLGSANHALNVPTAHLTTLARKKPKPVIMRAAYKRYLIHTPPPVLVIHLKRFQQLSKTHILSFSHSFKKLDDFVTFPEFLDLTPYLAPRKEDFGLGRKSQPSGLRKRLPKHKGEKCLYRLYAVVVHIGNMLGGHYIAYTALPDFSPPAGGAGSTDEKPSMEVKPPRQWAYISDTIVRLTTLEEVLKAKAYICMYERI